MLLTILVLYGDVDLLQLMTTFTKVISMYLSSTQLEFLFSAVHTFSLPSWLVRILDRYPHCSRQNEAKAAMEPRDSVLVTDLL